MGEEHKIIIRKIEKEIIGLGASKGIIIPQDFVDVWKIDDGTTVILSLEHGKHGVFLAIWKKEENQP